LGGDNERLFKLVVGQVLEKKGGCYGHKKSLWVGGGKGEKSG